MSTSEAPAPARSRERLDGRSGSRITRRHLVGVASAAMAVPVASVAAQQAGGTPEAGTPIASPAAAAAVDVETLLAVSTALVGSDALNEDAASALAQLIGADPARVSGFEALASASDPTALDDLPDDARTVANDILEYWYLGQFDGQPVENRAAIFFGLPVWQTVPYSTQPTLCKAFGYWATEVPTS